jgi:hypothetical protein
LAGETEVLGENLPSATFVHYKIPHDQTRFWPRAAAVGRRRLTACALARPVLNIYAMECSCGAIFSFSFNR